MLDVVADDLRAQIERALREFVSAASAELEAIGPELVAVGTALSEFVVDAGKRLRPSFCYWAAIAAGAPPSPELVRAAASLDLLQACALVHDDVIDHSDTRRGRPAIHRRFERLHANAAWAGDPAEFGAAAAILAGDLLLAWCEAMYAGWLSRLLTHKVEGLENFRQAFDILNDPAKYKAIKAFIEINKITDN